MRRRHDVNPGDGTTAPHGTSSERPARMRAVRQLGAALSLGGTALLAAGLLSYGPAVPPSAPGTVVVAQAATTPTPKPTKTPKSTKTPKATPTSTVTSTSSAVVPPATTTVPTSSSSAPAATGGVSGASTSSSSSSGGAVVGPPGTGADVPFVSGFLMLLTGGGLLAGARRRRS